MATNSLKDMASDKLCANLLSLAENRFLDDATRIMTYPLLRERAVPACIPRLVLRLKYEKDLTSNVLISDTLLKLGNGAGLSGLETIMQDESGDSNQRNHAAQICIARLGVNEQEPSFSNAWEALQLAQATWRKDRMLAGNQSVPSIDLMAECWRMIEKLGSQPLRPVDDARFVLSRLNCAISMPALIDAAFDESVYVREHALQTISWIGYPAGEWELKNSPEATTPLSSLLNDPNMRARALEALGALGHEMAAKVVVDWLGDSNIEVATAAADSILRCGSVAQAQTARNAARSKYLSPEAQLSLHLFLAETDTLPPSPPSPDDIAIGERKRRELWAQLRKSRPGQ